MGTSTVIASCLCLGYATTVMVTKSCTKKVENKSARGCCFLFCVPTSVSAALYTREGSKETTERGRPTCFTRCSTALFSKKKTLEGSALTSLHGLNSACIAVRRAIEDESKRAQPSIHPPRKAGATRVQSSHKSSVHISSVSRTFVKLGLVIESGRTPLARFRLSVTRP